jgi:glycosyltransferase 2 family protein
MTQRSKIRTALRWLPGVIIFPALVVVVLHYGSIEKFGELLRSARPEWLVPALAAQFATYGLVALSWHLVLLRAGEGRPFRTLFRLGVAKLYTDQAVPTGGISGSVLVVKALERRGVPNHVAMAALLVGMVSFYGADVVAAAVCLVLLWLHDEASGTLVALVTVFVLIEVAIPSAVLWARSHAKEMILPNWIKRLPGVEALFDAVADAPDDLLQDPLLIGVTSACQLGIIGLDALTLWLSCLAIGVPAPLWVTFSAFAVGGIVAMIAPSPLGLGTFAAGTTGMLALLGMPMEAALSATVLLRGLTFWLPMLPGVWIARQELSRM